MTFFSSHCPLFRQLLNTTHQFRAPFPDLSIITSSFCAPFPHFAPLLPILLTNFYPKFYAIFTPNFGFFRPFLGLRPGGGHPPLPLSLRHSLPRLCICIHGGSIKSKPNCLCHKLYIS